MSEKPHKDKDNKDLNSDAPHNQQVILLLESIAKNGSLPKDTSENQMYRGSSVNFSEISKSLIICLLLCVIIALGYSDNTNYIFFPTYSDSTSASKSSSSKKSSSKPKTSSKKSSSESTSSESKSNSSSESFQEDIPNTNIPDSSYYPFNTVGNSSSNVLNGSFLAAQGEWLYYIDSNDNNALYKMRNSYADKQKVCDIAAKSVSLVGESAFIGCLELSTTVQDVKWDGSGTKMFTVGDDYITAFEDFMISADGSAIYKTYYETALKEKLYTGSPEMCCCENDKVYFTEDGTLYSFSLETPENIQIEIKGDVQCYAVTNDDIYYCMKNRLYSAKNPNNPLFDLQTSLINITDNVLYYADILNDNALCSINLDGSDKKIIGNLPTQAICVAGNCIAVKIDGEILLLQKN